MEANINPYSSIVSFPGQNVLIVYVPTRAEMTNVGKIARKIDEQKLLVRQRRLIPFAEDFNWVLHDDNDLCDTEYNHIYQQRRNMIANFCDGSFSKLIICGDGVSAYARKLVWLAYKLGISIAILTKERNVLVRYQEFLMKTPVD